MTDGVAYTQGFLEGQAAGFKQATDLLTKRSKATLRVVANGRLPRGKARLRVYNFVAEHPKMPAVKVVDQLETDFPTRRTGVKKRSAVYDTIRGLKEGEYKYIVADNKDRLSINDEA